MLEIRDISKQYHTGGLVQKALDHVSFNLRDNEFVAILGPSGSGKTTLLNIIGGLDRYDSGDLVINNVSTKKYRDRDWDSYRNHTIGFVFQSYNLIPHQTILSNVELALTISGIPARERKMRALEALGKVGLREQAHKIPNQLSGGQMQRVAIARALVNDPEILLADEPTGALDSETSLQVMDLLKEIAQDRLVVMVTHNPELADRYATRIINLKDGRIVSDTMPCETAADTAVHRNFGKSSMGYFASLALSFNNLMTKKTRTILVSFAGSIGIIGIALILSLSYGGTQYINKMEEKTLSEYPITITSSGFDLGSMMSVSMGDEEEPDEDAIRVRNVISGFFSGLRSNDLRSLKRWFDSGESGIQDVTRAIEYTYDMEPQIYRLQNGNARRIHPSSAFSALGYDSSSMSSMMSSAFSMDIFHVLPDNRELYEPQYELLAGDWPSDEHECVLVLTYSNSVSDLLLYEIGLRDADELDRVMSMFANGEYTEPEDLSTAFYEYEDFLDLTFRVVRSSDCYLYDEEYKVWKDKTEDRSYMRELVKKGEPLTISGIVKPNDSDTTPVLSSGICYPASLLTRLEKDSRESDIIKAQLADSNTNVFTGKPFGDEEEGSGFDMASLIAINEDVIRSAFTFDIGTEEQDLFSGFMDFSKFDFSNLNLQDMDLSDIKLPAIDLDSIIRQLNIRVDRQQLIALLGEIAQDYSIYASYDESSDFKRLPEALATYFTEGNADELIAEALKKFLEENADNFMTEEQIREMLEDITEAYLAYLQEHMPDPEMTEEELRERLLEILSDPETDEEEKAQKIEELLAGMQQEIPADPAMVQAFMESEEGQAILQEKNEEIREQLSKIEFPEEDIKDLNEKLKESYETFAAENAYPDAARIQASLNNYFNQESTRQKLMNGVSRVVNLSEISAQINSMITAISESVMGEVEGQMTGLIAKIIEVVSNLLATSISTQMTGLTEGLQDMFRIDPSLFADAIEIKTSPEELREILVSLMTKERASYSGNLKKLGYMDPETPSSISIYPIGFDEKAEVVRILNGYNDRMRQEDKEDQVIVYTDIVGSLMSSVTKIIDIISKILIAFVAISLVVSSIMIGVITYISVLERKKEIGILRSMGASKRNIANVFNAETFLIGLLAGAIGVGLTLLILIPANIIIHKLTGAEEFTAMLPAGSAGILILISIVLTLIGGFIPSRKAAQQDPVEALRTE